MEKKTVLNTSKEEDAVIKAATKYKEESVSIGQIKPRLLQGRKLSLLPAGCYENGKEEPRCETEKKEMKDRLTRLYCILVY